MGKEKKKTAGLIEEENQMGEFIKDNECLCESVSDTDPCVPDTESSLKRSRERNTSVQGVGWMGGVKVCLSQGPYLQNEERTIFSLSKWPNWSRFLAFNHGQTHPLLLLLVFVLDIVG